MSSEEINDLVEDISNDTTKVEELEQYGVWVKAGPEDVEEEIQDSDFALEDLDSSEGNLSSEEEDLLGDLEMG